MLWTRRPVDSQAAGVLDPFIGKYKARFELDERELREMAGKLRGTAGVEHSVDTFIGLAQFKPTGTKVLDPFAIQANIHLEKTNFFSVSTHGVNDYTFLEVSFSEEVSGFVRFEVAVILAGIANQRQ